MTPSALAQWFDTFKTTPESKRLSQNPVAYFCSEFALDPNLPTYAGGLGVLAGDLVREAADQNFPLIGIGLYYHQGYVERVPPVHLQPEQSGLKPLQNEKGETVTFPVPMSDHQVFVRAWVFEKGNVKVYFMDTDLEQNSPADRHITDQLYTSEKEIRLKQEIVLGMGGIRLIEYLGIHPSVFHANEGHSAFLVFELIKREMKRHKVDFSTGAKLARERLVFTNHTLVVGGHEIFSKDLISALFSNYAMDIQTPVDNLVDLGLVQDSSLFSMTLLSLRQSNKANAVSKLHHKKAAEIWADHPMDQITNGIHIPTWDKLKTSDRSQIWTAHQKNKQDLLSYIKSKTGEYWDDKTCLLGWARRLVKYKRPLVLFEDLERLIAIANSKERPLKIIFSGHPHATDPEGKKFLTKLQELFSGPLAGIGVFLPDHGLELVPKLISGCDIWLNTPVVGYEACGTSGMKAALNGVLPLTTRDGWADEVDLLEIGWYLDDTRTGQDVLDQLNLILPLYYDQIKNADTPWLTNMKNARELILNEFSTTRMLKEYIEKLYLPTLKYIHEKS